MNLAFPTAFLFAVLLPGLIFLRIYDRGWGPTRGLLPTKPVFESLQDEIARSPIPALVLHVIWGCVCKLIGHPIDLRASLALVLGSFGKENVFFVDALNSVANNSRWVSAYFLSIWWGAAILGYLSNRIVWKYRLDMKLPFLRSNDYWFYLFRGERVVRKSTSPIVAVRVSAVMPCGTETFIYRGIFYHYIGHRGALDEIWLRYAERRCFAGDKPGDQKSEEYYRIEGDFLILKASELRTINLRYIDRESVEEALVASKLSRATRPDDG